MEAMNTVSEKIQELKNKGYTENFFFEKNQLKTDKSSFSAEEVKIEEEYRFEGKSNPDDLSILYQLTTNDGTKGTIVDGFGPTANADLAAFLLQAES